MEKVEHLKVFLAEILYTKIYADIFYVDIMVVSKM